MPAGPVERLSPVLAADGSRDADLKHEEYGARLVVSGRMRQLALVSFAETLGGCRMAAQNSLEERFVIHPARVNQLNGRRAPVDLTKRHRVWAIIGSDDAELVSGEGEPRQIDYFNSAFAISPEGELTGNYRKRRLVIFGEYVPFVKQLPFLRNFSPAGEGGFTPGKGATPFDLDDLDVLAAILICFEDTFPHLVPEYVKPETDLLVNLTNNGWFGESAAQWQHAATAIFRAVENRIPLVRCANNGLTCWVDEVGRMHQVYYPGTADIYGPGYKIVEVPVQAPGELRELSFYTRHGDVFGWSCVGLVGACLLPIFSHALRQRRERLKSSGHTPAEHSQFE